MCGVSGGGYHGNAFQTSKLKKSSLYIVFLVWTCKIQTIQTKCIDCVNIKWPQYTVIQIDSIVKLPLELIREVGRL